MVLCIIAFFVFAVMSIFSAKYRPLAREGLKCVFKTLTLKPCDTGLDDRIKAKLVSGLLKFSPGAARLLNKQFVVFSWLFVILTVASFAYTVYGFYNFYVYGNCDGPGSTNSCVLNDITGDYGRFSEPTDLIAPTSYNGINSGNQNASLVIVEFGCFTCPYTKKAETVVNELMNEYDGEIYYVFKPFPLPNHDYSSDAANAVLCARDQGKHFEFQKEIFRQQDVCTTDGIIAIKNIAEDVGLNMTEFNRCYDNNETEEELAEYVQQGKDAHIYATPTFFINGKPVIGPKTLDQMKCEIEKRDSLVKEVGCLFGQWWK
ncbi:MAG: thioredoxin domain-containing protein [Candidatus Micrarchaeota archaeon]